MAPLTTSLSETKAQEPRAKREKILPPPYVVGQNARAERVDFALPEEHDVTKNSGENRIRRLRAYAILICPHYRSCKKI